MILQIICKAKFNWGRYISSCSLRNNSCLKDVDDENFSLLSQYRSKNHINLSICKNILPKYLTEYLTNDLNKNLPFDIRHFKMIEERALESFHLEKKYWGCLFSCDNFSDGMHVVDDYFLLKLFRSVITYKSRIMTIEFSLEQRESCENDKDKGKHSLNAKLKKPVIDEFYEVEHIKNDGKINYDDVKRKYEKLKPSLLYIDETNNPYHFDYESLNNFRGIHNCTVITNMSNKANIITQQFVSSSPFHKSDIVFSYFNENIRAHNCYIIFYKKGFKNVNKDGILINYELEEKLKNTFYKNNLSKTIFSLGTSFKCMNSTEFNEYILQCMKNTYILYTHINRKWWNAHYSENSIFVNLSLFNLIFNIKEFHTLCQHLNIHFDILHPWKYKQKSFNIGTNYLTALGLLENDMKVVAEFLNRALYLYLYLKKNSTLSNYTFTEYLANGPTPPDLLSLASEISSFITSFPSAYEL
ncbi:serine hydroxymethyltransferase, putative [Plasmodium ovale]|uniref:Serine hydroxymethyltransferase, putative n=1 Tax=Plasmodium ovale TaxID=36330 RepID=A0A1D3TLC0_PLAOA|nr:serine hydroxymethyltransferase, putative [Plasmodium ovale]